MAAPHDANETTSSRTGRRAVLRALGACGVAPLGAGSVAARTASDDDPPAAASDERRGAAPRGVATWSDPVALGDGELRTYTVQTPGGEPIEHGVAFDDGALAGLPTADELAARGASGDPGDKYGPEGEAIQIHGAWSQEFFVPIPAAEATPFTFLGLTWNPAGHPPPGIYDRPHFDVHFHTLEPSTVDAIEGLEPASYELPAERVPAGYERLPEPALDGDYAVVTDMGEHLADPSSPELAGEAPFTHTLIWGAYDVDGDGLGELTFVEPMLTRAHLAAARGVEHHAVAQPSVYPNEGAYPQRYTVRRHPSAPVVTVSVGDFRRPDASAVHD